MLRTYFTSYCNFGTFGCMELTNVMYVNGKVCESFYTVSSYISQCREVLLVASERHLFCVALVITTSVHFLQWCKLAQDVTVLRNTGQA